MCDEIINVHYLRRRWKPHKERLLALRRDHPTPIRFHRACSWLARVEKLTHDDVDLILIAQWIAFNSLYGQWDEDKQWPVGDRECWRVFLERILGLDADGLIGSMLRQHRRLVLTLFEDRYLSSVFWQQPDQHLTAQAIRPRVHADRWYYEQDWLAILNSVVPRIYLMRCQLTHGAATYGSKLNRGSLRHCAQMMQHLLTAVLRVVVEHGADEDWGIMCYPPLSRPVSRIVPNEPTRPKHI